MSTYLIKARTGRHAALAARAERKILGHSGRDRDVVAPLFTSSRRRRAPLVLV